MAAGFQRVVDCYHRTIPYWTIVSVQCWTVHPCSLVASPWFANVPCHCWFVVAAAAAAVVAWNAVAAVASVTPWEEGVAVRHILAEYSWDKTACPDNCHSLPADRQAVAVLLDREVGHRAMVVDVVVAASTVVQDDARDVAS